MTTPDPTSGEGPSVGGPPGIEPGGPYARYVLGVLVLVYVLNFLDRQILAILTERIKADLGMTPRWLCMEPPSRCSTPCSASLGWLMRLGSPAADRRGPRSGAP
jgi:hypothetical protein